MKRKNFCSLTIYITEICDSFCWCYLIRVEHFFTYLVVVYIYSYDPKEMELGIIHARNGFQTNC